MLAVTYDRKFSVAPHKKNMYAATLACAPLVARLGPHLPRGVFLHQMATGLVLGKLSHKPLPPGLGPLSRRLRYNAPPRLQSTMCAGQSPAQQGATTPPPGTSLTG